MTPAIETLSAAFNESIFSTGKPEIVRQAASEFLGTAKQTELTAFGLATALVAEHAKTGADAKAAFNGLPVQIRAYLRTPEMRSALAETYPKLGGARQISAALACN